MGLFANDDRNIPWNEVYSNLKMRGKRHSEPSRYPWEAVYSLRGKKTVANLPWQMGLQSPMLRGKKAAPRLPWAMNLQIPMLRGKKSKPRVNLPWKMHLKSPMLRGKKSSMEALPMKMTIDNQMSLGNDEDLTDIPKVKPVIDEMLLGKKKKNFLTKTNAIKFDYLSPMFMYFMKKHSGVE